MNEGIQLLETEDGSFTLYNPELRETYHSKHGALGESLHVYIDQGLRRISESQTEINILEIGFGTGLNAFLTLEHLPPGKHIRYFTLEPYPLEPELIHSYYARFREAPASLFLLDRLLENGREQLDEISPGFHFRMLNCTLQELKPGMLSDASGKICQADLVYFDAFAPSRQPELWQAENLDRTIRCMSDQGLLVTYCAQGRFKRDLKSLGMRLESPPGAFGKREMTLAWRQSAG